MGDINKAVSFMINTAKDNIHGYDQRHRNGPDYDCSSLVGTALYYAGFAISPYSWTGNLESQLRKAGFVDCKAPWKAGDIHLNRGNHVCMSINESQIVEASINEKGTATGGKTGDQTGKEIQITSYYNYYLGWDLHLRFTGVNTNSNKGFTIEEIAKQVIAGKWGVGNERKRLLENAGYNYDEVQSYVNGLFTKGGYKSNGEVAREVIKGVWGVGKERKNRLEKAGYNYDEVQKLVNQMLG